MKFEQVMTAALIALITLVFIVFALPGKAHAQQSVMTVIDCKPECSETEFLMDTSYTTCDEIAGILREQYKLEATCEYEH